MKIREALADDLEDLVAMLAGSRRCQIEGVRIHRSYQGKGLGRKLIEWAIDRARERHYRMVQLTTDKQRPDALRFYGSLGFEPTHEGLKLKVESSCP